MRQLLFRIKGSSLVHSRWIAKEEECALPSLASEQMESQTAEARSAEALVNAQVPSDTQEGSEPLETAHAGETEDHNGPPIPAL